MHFYKISAIYPFLWMIFLSGSLAMGQQVSTDQGAYMLEDPIATDSTILKILKAIKDKDGNELESLRDVVKPEMKAEIVQYWKASMSWELKDGFVWVMMDQNSTDITPMLEDALRSPYPDTKTAALCILLGSACDFESLYTPSGALNQPNFAAGVKRYMEIKASAAK